jgi:oligoendopeptidase F
MATHSAEGIRWDLSDLFAAYDDARIESTLSQCRAQAESFAQQFRAIMEQPESLTAETLSRALRHLENIYEALGRVGSYAGLLYAADTTKPEYQDLEQRVEQRSTEIRNLLLFFELAWLKVDVDVADILIHDQKLESFEHYLTSLRRYRPHTLSEPEEKIVNEKDNTGRNAFGRLFSEITSSLTFKLDKDGTVEELNLSQLLSLLHEPERDLRRRAMDTLYQGLAQHGQVLTFIYDTLIQDHRTMDRLRDYSNPIAQRHLFNEIDGAAVKTMMEVTESNYGTAHDYFRL